jgi:phage-related protein
VALTVGELLAIVRVENKEFDKGVDQAERRLVTAGARMSATLGGLQGTFSRFGSNAFSTLQSTLGRTVSTLATLGKVGGFALAAAEMGAMAGKAVQLAGALLPAANALLLLPAAAGAAAVAFATFKVGVAGVGNAFKYLEKGNEKKLAQVLQYLAPNARAFVLQVKALKPAFEALRIDVQNHLFAGLADTLRTLAATHLPAVHAAMNKVADAFNTGLRKVGEVLNSAVGKVNLSALFSGAAAAVGNLAAALAPVATILLTLFGVGAPLLDQLTKGAGTFAQHLADIVGKAAASGQLAKGLKDGLSVLADLGRVGLQVVSILHGIFSAGAAAGGDPLGAIGAGLKQIAAIVNSPAGQQGLTALFQSLATVGAALAPILAALATALVPVARIIADLATALAPGVTVLVKDLAAALATLAPLAAPVGAALGEIARVVGSALGPIAGIIADLIVGIAPGFTAFVKGIADGLTMIGPAAAPIGKAIGDVLTILGQAFTPIASIISDLAVALMPSLATVASALVIAIDALTPAARPVGEALAAIFVALAPLLPALAAVFAPVLTLVAGLLKTLAVALAPLILLAANLAVTVGNALLPVFQQLVDSGTLANLAEATVQVAQAFLPLVPVIAQIVASMGTAFVTQLIGLAQVLAGQVIPVVLTLARTFSGNLMEGLTALAPDLPLLAVALLNLAFAGAQLIVALMPLIVLWAQIGTQVLDFMVKSGLLQAGLILVIGAIQLAAFVIQALAGPVRFIVGLIQWFATTFLGLGNSAKSGIGEATSAVSGIGSAVKGAFSSAGSWLVDAGRNIISGLISGIKNSLGWLGNVLGGVGDFIAAHKGPPARDRRLLIPAGVALMAGLMAGMQSQMPAMRTGLGGITGGITAAAATPNISVGGASVTVVIDGRALDTAHVRAMQRNPREVALANQVGTRALNFAGGTG